MNIYLMSVLLYSCISAITLWMLFTITFVIAQKIKLWKILDIAWGCSFIIVAFLGWGLFFKFQTTPQVIPIFLVTLWGLRLSIYLTLRGLKSGEDPRYTALKVKGKHAELKAYFQIFLLQGLLVWIMCIPFYFYLPIMQQTIQHPLNMSILAIGFLCALIALCIEWIADYQLLTLKKPGQLLSEGLWKYSRHPNYLGEISFWWSMWLITKVIYVPTSPLYPSYTTMVFFAGIITLISPMTITLIISKVTGPMTEKLMVKYPQWEEYKQNTPYIFPKLWK